MANEKRLINGYVAEKSILNAEKIIRSESTCDYDTGWADALSSVANLIKRMPIVDAYTEEQVSAILQQVKKLEISNQELETEYAWLKSCLNCKIRRECPRHCGKVVHDCDHWVYGDNVVLCMHCNWYDEDGEFCKFWKGVRHPEHSCGEGERKDND